MNITIIDNRILRRLILVSACLLLLSPCFSLRAQTTQKGVVQEYN